MNNSIYKKGLAVVLIFTLIIMASIGIKLSGKSKDIKISGENIKFEEEEVQSEEEKNQSVVNIIVDIDGAVSKPGVYEFSLGARVIDAINKAGGLTQRADTKNLNKARKLIDGEKIYIPEEGEEVYLDNENIQEKININTATKEQLMSLDGIGEVYSLRIIEYREKKRFTNIEEIKNVKGIGEKTFEKIKDKITT